jgi:hypothetical protein
MRGVVVISQQVPCALQVVCALLRNFLRHGLFVHCGVYSLMMALFLLRMSHLRVPHANVSG